MQNVDRQINYIEFVVGDISRAKQFYGDGFGWTFTDYGDAYCEFNDGFMKGGFAKGEPRVSGGPLIVLYSENLEKLQDAIQKAGGRIVQPVFDFPGGKRFHFEDPDGYELAAWTNTIET